MLNRPFLQIDKANDAWCERTVEVSTMIVQYLKLSFSSELIYRVQMALTGLTLFKLVSQVQFSARGLMSYFSGRAKNKIFPKPKAKFTLGATCCDATFLYTRL